MREGGTSLPLPARSVRDAVCEAMGSAVPEGFRPQASTLPTLAAGADEPERVAVDRVAADTAVFDTDTATSYRDGVEDACDCLSRNLSALVADPPHLQGHAMSCPVRLKDSLRLARLARWQRQP